TLKKVTTAFVLGAGLGTRLRPYTQKTPKPLLPIQGKPLICHTFDRLLASGIQRLIVNTHHCPEQYTETFPAGHYRDIPITFRYEPELLETGGGLKNIEDLIDPEQPLLVHNGDILTDLPLQQLIDAHDAEKSEVTLALRTSGEPRNVMLAEDGTIQDFRQTLLPDQTGNTLYTGIGIFEPIHLDRLTAAKKESLVPIWIEMIRLNCPPRGIVIDQGIWNDIGTVDIYEKINQTDP
ncbi:MAG: nucleotidyltransferase family protein, partial [Verrucomicrobiota bacterium]